MRVLLGTQPVKAVVRQGQFFKLQTALEIGGNDGLFTFGRYREWMEKRTTGRLPRMKRDLTSDSCRGPSSATAKGGAHQGRCRGSR